MDISSLSDWEYIQIVGHYNSLRKKEQIDPRLLAKGYSEEAIRQLEKQVGNNSADYIVSLNLRLHGNLRRFEYPYLSYALSMFDKYDKHGVLPHPGAHADQPAKLIEIFEILSQLQHELEEEMRREQERKSKRNGRNKN